MAIYKASEELVNILLKNGLEETTEKNLPVHYKNMVENGYDPNKVKRDFSYNGKRVLIFDYVVIKPKIKGFTSGRDMKTELTIDELKSIIVFSKLPYQTVNGLYRNNHNYVTQLHNLYFYIKEHPDFTKSKNKFRNELITKEFENIQI
ncbi:hypothetical protein [Myroides odoratus]|uniref:Uncharacterized protein n=1 Tax=Myroides odoratus TaxID=256 RepID=A0A9Q6Z7G4_MYROD|nr:hypothetical protein [Myroides odoratus]EHQ41785.1 hypothetical protein Myrod_0950 [Myroides odoratus DSM 2801]EKB08986.1 hypothetical protein HMPREF9716_00493 [Myroides odoratus CIP 103059]QQT99187.1 hypothetical protein I6I88_13330 [Myroides odoratus]WQD58615.1 hypothetical protein U0010_05630 [Myroides odoratus]STZ29046.1 Uncharacterised protein [Myroides odoratus]